MVYQNRNRSILRTAGHIAQASGHYNTGHILRAMDASGIGSKLTQMAGGFDALSAAAGPLVAGLVGLSVAAKLVEVGFGAVAETAMAFVGAISQIGGARGLQAMIVESATSERMSADIAANASDKVSSGQVMGILRDISQNTEFTKEQAGTMARSFLSKRGQFGEFEQLKDFIPNLVSAGGGLSPEQAGAIVGQIRVQFPEMSMNQTKEAAMSLWSQGKQGAVELKDTKDITQVLGFAHAVSPNLQAGLNLEMGMVQLAQRFTGGDSARQAVTGVRRIQEQMLLPGNATKEAKMRSFFGQDYIAHDETGRAVLRNAPRDNAKLAYGAYSGDKGLEGLFDSRGLKSIRGWVEGDVSNQFSGKSKEEKIDILEGVFKKMEETGSHLEEFNSALQIVKDTAEYQLRTAFNKLAGELEGELIKLMPQLTEAVKGFVEYMVSHKDQLGESMQDFLTGLIFAAKALPPLAEAALYVAQEMAKVVLKVGILTGLSTDTINSLVDLINLDPKNMKKESAESFQESAIKTIQDNNLAAHNKLIVDQEIRNKGNTYQGLPGDTSGASKAGSGADHLADLLKAIARSQEIANKHAAETAINTRKTPQAPSRSTNGN